MKAGLLASVVIPTYNRNKYLKQAIDSALAQTLRNYEIIVVDDGSTDGTNRLLDSYGNAIRAIRQENQGESVARNTGISFARGKYIAFLDDDDLWLPQKLERQVRTLETDPTLGLVACQGLVINEYGEIVDGQLAFRRSSSGFVGLREIILESPVGPSASMCRRDVISAVGSFDPCLQYGEDWEWAMRVASKFRIKYLDEPLVYMRSQAGRQSDFRLDPKKALKRYEDHLKIVERLDNLLPDGQSRLKERALAREHAEIAINNIANGRHVAGREHLCLAAQLDPERWLRGPELDTIALAYAHSLVATSGVKSATDFLTALLGRSLPSCRSVAKKRLCSCQARLYRDLSYVSGKNRNWESVQRYAVKAISQNPSTLLDRGFVSRFLASLFRFESLSAMSASVMRHLQGLRSVVLNQR